ncbi:hypothetical protein FXO37_04575 [Capsicum annuum]|nr:hypothetical protein FXO37_04575 [Capsicum annuum]
MCLWVVSQGHKPIIGRSQLICTGGSLMVTVQYSNDYKDDKNEEIESSKETGCRAPEDPILYINDCDFFVHHYSDKHNCPFDYRNAGQNAIAKANPIVVAEKLNKI